MSKSKHIALALIACLALAAACAWAADDAKKPAKKPDGDGNPLARAGWNPDEQWHHLSVETRANWLEASLDGRRLFRVKDDAHLNLPSLRSGGVVLAARQGTRSRGKTVVRFDDFEVSLLEP